MKKISISLTVTKKEAVDYFVKSTVSCDDVNVWLEHSKKDYTMRKLQLLKELVHNSGIDSKNSDFPKFLNPVYFDNIAHEVEKQVIELIIGSED